MYYTRLQVVCSPEFSEILMAEVAEAGFDTFMETERGFEAYVEKNQYTKDKLQEVKEKYSGITPVVFYLDRVEKKNWNEEWEKSYEPILVENKCLIRASFHQPEKTYPYEIIITPKMSFGTGHHQTTYLMIKSQLEMDHTNKVVMDAGTGTGVLAILASKLGASRVEAIDIDEWSILNSKENADLNGCPNISIRQGKLSDLTFEGDFDIILANINKNILLEELHQYVAYLKPGGRLLLSGFYEKDIPDLLTEALRYALQHVQTDVRDNWASLLLAR
ncbi:MAG: 50S ribosomal protein L11 methyltransferase [Flammeovirgaceae bacterium]|nr:MAG: 50S ribosomal protein L11 methyltransferase [Flammeovirgaceae bacterium]